MVAFGTLLKIGAVVLGLALLFAEMKGSSFFEGKTRETIDPATNQTVIVEDPSIISKIADWAATSTPVSVGGTSTVIPHWLLFVVAVFILLRMTR